MIVYFDVAEMPNKIREVIYKGNKHLKQADLESLAGVRRGMPLNPVQNKLACQAIERKLQEDGRIFAKVVLDEGGQVGDSRVVFNITEGPEVKVTGVDFIGHGSWVSSARLRTQINSSRTYLGIGGTYDPRKLEADVMQLRDYYRNVGFLDADVSPELTWRRGSFERQDYLSHPRRRSLQGQQNQVDRQQDLRFQRPDEVGGDQGRHLL